jgi:hypothetical protein
MIPSVKRETRANFYFLVLFLVISLPGAVLLFRKKLDPSSPRLDQPDPVVQALPFMVPPPTPPGVRWMVPPKTQGWLTEANRARTGAAEMLSSVVAGPDWEPVISQDHHLQVTSVVPGPPGAEVDLILWNLPKPPEAGNLAVKYHEAGSSAESITELINVEPVPVPPDVRKELVGYGFTRPPTEVTWLKVRVAVAPTAGSDMELTVDSPALHTSVRFLVR